MSGQWQPGDVAVGDVGQVARVLMFRTTNPDEWALAQKVATGNHYASGFASRNDEVCNIRPLVVIDPEDREQVERLCIGCLGHNGDSWVDGFQDALREFANPTPPKPDEPKGVGAVVLDAKGNYWTRIADGDVDPIDPVARTHSSPPWRHRGVAAKWWANLNAVKVLSEGVPQ